MKNLPANTKAYKRTPIFTENSIPEGLQNAHQTKPSVWGKIVVLEGQLLYRILEPVLEEVHLCPEQTGAIEPTVLHEVRPLGKVRFYVEFHRVSAF